jgi:putative hydrolase of the HAD superfamily
MARPYITVPQARTPELWLRAHVDRLIVVRTTSALKHLLLDFGGPVLLTPFELTGKAEQTLGPMPWRGPFDHGSDDEYVRWQRGEITEREYWSARADQYGLDIKGLMRHFYEPAGDYLVRPEMTDLIARHRALGRIVGVLTNDMNAFHGPEWKEGISVIKQFDFIVDGSITGFLKPDPRAFRLALDAFEDPDPARVVFVDDQQSNLRGAEAVGITTVYFDPTAVTESLERIEVALA